MNVCTIVARNYLPFARVLAETFLEHNPQSRFTVLVLDGHEDLDEEVDVVGPYDIGIERSELHRMAMIYDLKELATAVKPWFLRQLANNGATAMYFDPDIAVYAPLDELDVLARTHSIVLTPHTTAPIPDDGCLPDEKMILQAGIYNLGFIGVGPGSEEFLTWWSDRLQRHCIVDVEQALFVDQRWIDFVPALFTHAVVANPAYNVAYWNLHGRELASAGSGYRVDGEPLRFFHFSGFKPETPQILSHHTGTRPRILLSRHGDLARLCREYGDQVLEHGYNTGAPAYIFGQLPGGMHVDRTMRRLFRADLLEAEQEGRDALPDPFDPSSTARFVESLREPANGSRGSGVSRYAYAFYSDRPDLQKAFPDVFGGDAAGYLRWLRASGQARVELLAGAPARSSAHRRLGARGSAVAVRTMDRLEKRLRSVALSHPTLARGKPLWRAAKRASVGTGGRSRAAHGVEQRSPSPIEIASVPTHGVNLVGYLSAELGIGEVARKILTGLEHTTIDYSTISYERTLSRQAHRFDERRTQQAPFDTNVICVNADQLPTFREDVGPAFFTHRHTIGVWFWEVSEFPAVFHGAFKYVDEIWVATRFVQDAIAATTSTPVAIIPLPLEVPPTRPMSRAELGLPEGFCFLFSFDFLSIVERKNPIGLIDAFTRAFAEGEGPQLVLKSINGEHDLPSLERLRLAAAGRPDIHLIDGYFGSEEKNALMAKCDCYVSLHRSEGFGLTMAEAMAYSKPVIATGYSGNVDFMDESNSHLVPYSLVRIPGGCEPYPTSAVWADADLDAAASAMQRVYGDQGAARKLGEHARKDVLTRFSIDRTAAFLTERLGTPGRGQVGPSTAKASIHAAAEPLAFASSKVALGPGGHFARAKRRRPGLRALRAALRRLLWPYILDQHELSVSLVDALGRMQWELEAMARESRGHEQNSAGALSDLHGELSTLASQLATASFADPSTVDDFRNELARLEAELTASPYVSDRGAVEITNLDGRIVIGYDAADSADIGLYRGFEDAFRGSEDFIRERQRVYLDVVRGHHPVLDVGCGRGEFLELLAEAGIPASGVDLDLGMVERCREKGLAVEHADLVTYLEVQRDHSLGVMFSAQVIEHLSFDTLNRFLELASHKLEPSGLFIAETVNPHSIQAFKTFWVDPTHRAPIFPEVAVTLARLHGFASARVLFPLGTDELEVDRRTQGEYALIATRGSSPRP